MKNFIFGTSDNWSGLIARLAIGLVIFPHGAQKALGWFGGFGFEGFTGYLTNVLGVPYIIAVMVILIEFVGSICLVLGVASRLWAFAIMGLFTGIILKVHVPFGFFMNWGGKQAGEGFEFHLLVLALALLVAINGGGKYSVDQKISSGN